jgi:hypothetical protein
MLPWLSYFGVREAPLESRRLTMEPGKLTLWPLRVTSGAVEDLYANSCRFALLRRDAGS